MTWMVVHTLKPSYARGNISNPIQEGIALVNSVLSLGTLTIRTIWGTGTTRDAKLSRPLFASVLLKVRIVFLFSIRNILPYYQKALWVPLFFPKTICTLYYHACLINVPFPASWFLHYLYFSTHARGARYGSSLGMQWYLVCLQSWKCYTGTKLRFFFDYVPKNNVTFTLIN